MQRTYRPKDSVASMVTTASSDLSSPLVQQPVASVLHAPLHYIFDEDYYRKDYLKRSFSDLITHSRSGNATMVDSDGLLKWAPHNLQTDSQDFSGASWSTTNTTVTANAADAPDGTATADKIEQTASGDWRITGLNSVVDADYTYGVFLKTVSGTGSIGIRIYDGASFSDTLCSVTEEWQLFTVSSSGTTQNIYIDSRVSGSTLTEVYAWGAHLYRSDLGGMVDNPDRGDSYVPTTSSAVYLPRRGHHVYNGSAWVNEGLLHESEARTNLVTYSEDFSAFTVSNVTLTADSETAPDGNVGATRVVTGAANSFLYENYAVSAETTYTGSMFIKYGSVTAITVAIYDDSNAAFITTDAAQTVQDFGACKRISFTFATPAGCSNIRIYPHRGNGSGQIGDFYLWGLQLEAASTPSSYIPTAGATVTRAAETLTIPSANLPWPTPQVIGDELVTNGTFDTDTSGWSAGGGSSLSIVSGQLRVTASAGGYAYQNITTTLGQAYTISGTSSGAYLVQLSVYNGAGAGSTLIKSTGNVSTGDHEFTFIASSTQTAIRMVTATGTAVNIDWDNISVREINPLSVSIQMDGRITYADTNTGGSTSGKSGEVIFVEWWADSDNFIELLNTTNTGTGKLGVNQKALAAFDSVASGELFSPGILVPFNIASRHGSTFINGAVNGVALTADTTPTALPDLSSTDLELGYDYMGTIKTFRIWDKDLGDTGIEEASS